MQWLNLHFAYGYVDFLLPIYFTQAPYVRIASFKLSMRSISYAFSIAFLLIAFFAPAQVSRVESLLSRNASAVNVHTKPEVLPGKAVMLLETGFNNGLLLHPSSARELQGKVIESIELVYTKYAETETFDQGGLNRKRLNSLSISLPGAFTNSMIVWRLVGQQPATAEEARKQFHGFVIVYRPTPTEESMKEELLYLKELVGEDSHSDGSEDPGTNTKGHNTGSGSDQTSLLKKDSLKKDSIPPPPDAFNGYYLGSVGGEGTWKVQADDSLALWSMQFKGLVVMDTIVDVGLFGRKVIYVMGIPEEGDTTARNSAALKLKKTFARKSNVDSVVTHSFNRNKSKWKNTLVVTDLTGSMSPYSSQLLSWYKKNLRSSGIRHIVFFNDGDKKRDKSKVIGSTGGIYHAKPASVSEVLAVAEKTMDAGGGGDVPENNIEAALEGLKQCSDCNDIVMIADNWSSPRDMELAYKLKNPLHIIVCGAALGINPDYLTLAYQTGGSVHVMEQDVEGISEMKEGEVITVGSSNYRLEKGRFVKVEHFK